MEREQLAALLDRTLNDNQALRDRVEALAKERDEMALSWSNCAMRNAITLREIQLLAAAGLESGCVEGDEECTLFTSIHRLSCEAQGLGADADDGLAKEER